MADDISTDLFNCRSLRTIVLECLDQHGGDMEMVDLVAAVENNMSYAEQRRWEIGAFFRDVKDQVHTRRADPLDNAYVMDGRATQLRLMDPPQARKKLIGIARLGVDSLHKVRVLAAAYNADRGEQVLDADEIILEAEMAKISGEDDEG